MKYLIALLLSNMLLALNVHAEDQADETLLVVMEVDKFMINWSPSTDTLGRAIVYSCSECEPQIMTFGPSTEFYINEQKHSINKIAEKVDWTGLITVTNKEPSKVIRFTAY